jgi:hypothetical protein
MPTLNVTPSKHIYDALIQDIDTNRAIFDLLDNAIDNWKIEDQIGTLRIDISMDEAHIEIKDYSGGIDKETLPLLLMPGGTRGGRLGIRGVWGVGSKRALFSLGKKFVISTRKHGSVGFILEVDEDWFKRDEGEDKWTIEYEEDESLEEGTTTITVANLKVLLDPHSVSMIKRYIARTYRDEIKDKTLEIVFNDERISIFPDVPWAKSQYAPPARYITDIPVPNSDRHLHAEITAGVMIQPGEDYTYGIDFVGNRRLILHNNLDGRMGFVKEKLGFPHPTINRFKAVVRIDGDSRDIPWNSAKSDINTNHPVYISIVDLVVQVSRQYVSFLRRNYEVTSKLFRDEAEETDIQEICLEYGKDFQKVVKEYKEAEKEIRINFTVPELEYKQLVEHFGLGDSTRKEVGLFLFERALKEIRGIAED